MAVDRGRRGGGGGGVQQQRRPAPHISGGRVKRVAQQQRVARRCVHSRTTPTDMLPRVLCRDGAVTASLLPVKDCKALVYPPVSTMPKVSVIIIYYNEATSTLFRNIVAVLNKSPPALLGEILLVDDKSSLEELKEGFGRHLAALQKQLPAGLIRAVRRRVRHLCWGGGRRERERGGGGGLGLN